jgi:DNA repair exonuclease SbcCD ATPase subunit
MHTVVRRLQRQMREADAETKELKTLLSRLRGDNDAAERQKLEQHIAELGHAKEALAVKIPADWQAINKTFKKLKKDERTARLKYRRAADNAYGPVQKVMKTLAGNDAFISLKGELAAMRKRVESDPEAELVTPLKVLGEKFGLIEGASSVKGKISKARRVLKGKTPDRARALKAMDNALKAYDKEMVWRGNDFAALLAGVNVYEGSIKGSIGIRQQDRLTHDQALFVASCGAGHRDISLSF